MTRSSCSPRFRSFEQCSRALLNRQIQRGLERLETGKSQAIRHNIFKYSCIGTQSVLGRDERRQISEGKERVPLSSSPTVSSVIEVCCDRHGLRPVWAEDNSTRQGSIGVSLLLVLRCLPCDLLHVPALKHYD